MGRAPCCSKIGLNKGRWTAEEDAILAKYIQTHGEGSWRDLPKNAGLLRCGKSCRLRWMNYLRSGVKRGNISTEEEELIVRLHAMLGNRWSLIAGRMPGRTDNDIKNYWNTHLSRKLADRGIDPVTHKPFFYNNKKLVSKTESVDLNNESSIFSNTKKGNIPAIKRKRTETKKKMVQLQIEPKPSSKYCQQSSAESYSEIGSSCPNSSHKIKLLSSENSETQDFNVSVHNAKNEATIQHENCIVDKANLWEKSFSSAISSSHMDFFGSLDMEDLTIFDNASNAESINNSVTDNLWFDFLSDIEKPTMCAEAFM